MPFTLSDTAKAGGFGLIGPERVDSTNSEAQRQIEAGADLPLWIAALEQTAGRGRHGRSWQSQPGNLAASLVLELPCDPATIGTLGFVAGLAMRDAISAAAPLMSNDLTLKWPNDILLSGAKLVGILLEAQHAPDGPTKVTIGMGVNIVAAPEDTNYATTFINKFDAHVTAEQIFTALTQCWISRFAQWNMGQGIADTLADWRDTAYGIGQPIIVRKQNEQLSGVFERLDDEGRLVLRLPDNSFSRVTAGDIYFG